MNQCPYRIKQEGNNCWWHCKLEVGHFGDHKTWMPLKDKPVFEGIWHLPVEKSTADPELQESR
jgi:hypothetical protein